MFNFGRKFVMTNKIFEMGISQKLKVSLATLLDVVISKTFRKKHLAPSLIFFQPFSAVLVSPVGDPVTH